MFCLGGSRFARACVVSRCVCVSVVDAQNSGSLDKRARELLADAALEKQKIRVAADANKAAVIDMLVKSALTVELK